MISLLKKLFIDHWQRKLLSLVLAIILWLLVHASMIENKLVTGIPVRVINLTQDETLEGMGLDGTLHQKMSLHITGHKSLLADLSGKDLEIIVDAQGKPKHWTSIITKKNLSCLNPEFDITKTISRVSPKELTIKKTKLVTETVPVLITKPIGEAPKGYQFLDVWPYQLSLKISGPEESIKRLKTRGLKLTFNLNEISRIELETLEKEHPQAEEISFFVPNSWKKVSVPFLSEFPIEITDPQAKKLRIDFMRQDLLPIPGPLPVTVCYLPQYAAKINPLSHQLVTSNFIQNKNGLYFIQAPLYAQGVSKLFLDLVKDRLEIAVLTALSSEKASLLWSAQVLYPQELENRYVARLMSESKEEFGDLQPQLREDYLRNRFRNYMTRFRLYTPERQKLSLQIEIKDSTIAVYPKNYPGF